VPPSEGGKFGEVFVDATVGLPIIVAAVIERLDKAKKGGSARKGAKAISRK
jgi:deoxyhypusine synthase